MTDAMTSLIDGIMYAVKTLINKAEYDQTVSGHILYYAGSDKYIVRVDGENYTVKSNGLFHPYDSVKITKPKNKWLNAYISYPNTVNITAEDLSADAEALRQKAEETRIENENKRISNEESRQTTYEEILEKSTQYDKAEKEREAACTIAIKALNESKTSIESSYNYLQNDYSTISQNINSSIADCEEIIERCEEAVKSCEDIAASGYVTNDQLADYATKKDLENIDLSGLCRLVQENGKVYLEVI